MASNLTAMAMSMSGGFDVACLGLLQVSPRAQAISGTVLTDPAMERKETVGCLAKPNIISHNRRMRRAAKPLYLIRY